MNFRRFSIDAPRQSQSKSKLKRIAILVARKQGGSAYYPDGVAKTLVCALAPAQWRRGVSCDGTADSAYRAVARGATSDFAADRGRNRGCCRCGRPLAWVGDRQRAIRQYHAGGAL